MNRLRLLLVALLVISSRAEADIVCRMVSGSMGFGTYDILSPSPTDTLATVTVTCDRDTGPPPATVTLALGAGANSTSVSARRLARVGGGDFLSYGLFRDVARSATWGFTAGVDTMSVTFNVPNKSSASSTFTVYGRIPAGQDVMAGSYSDSVQYTIDP